MMRRVLRGFGVLLAVLLALAAVAWVALRHGEPAVTSGDGDALARRMLGAVDAEAWSRTGAVRWTFFDGGAHLWDRARSLERYERGDLRVLLDLTSRRGLAWRGGIALSGADRDRALRTAWERWINDSFWLNPAVKCFDDGVSRAVVRDDDGGDALRVSYASGGVTPGDRYVWRLDASGRPRAWRMWVRVLPVPGLEASWEGWQRLATGAWVSTRHRMGPLTLTLRDVAGAETLAALVPGGDPFAALAGR